MKRAIAILTALTFTTQMATAQERSLLETELLSAMVYSDALGERLKPPGSAIRAFIAADMVDRKPTQRIDYTDYRVLKKPATLLGQKLLVVEEEYLTAYVGCCVDPGVGAIVLVTGDERMLRAFARENRCGIDEANAKDRLRDLNITVDGRAVSISCRDRAALGK